MASGNTLLSMMPSDEVIFGSETAPPQYAFPPVNNTLGGSANVLLTLSSTSTCIIFLLCSSSTLSRAALSSLPPTPKL